MIPIMAMTRVAVIIISHLRGRTEAVLIFRTAVRAAAARGKRAMKAIAC